MDLTHVCKRVMNKLDGNLVGGSPPDTPSLQNGSYRSDISRKWCPSKLLIAPTYMTIPLRNVAAIFSNISRS